MSANTLTSRELALVLAGLRALQRLYDACDGDLPDEICEILSDADMEHVDMEEVDELCERLNVVSEPDPALAFANTVARLCTTDEARADAPCDKPQGDSETMDTLILQARALVRKVEGQS